MPTHFPCRRKHHTPRSITHSPPQFPIDEVCDPSQKQDKHQRRRKQVCNLQEPNVLSLTEEISSKSNSHQSTMKAHPPFPQSKHFPPWLGKIILPAENKNLKHPRPDKDTAHQPQDKIRDVILRKRKLAVFPRFIQRQIGKQRSKQVH